MNCKQDPWNGNCQGKKQEEIICNSVFVCNQTGRKVWCGFC